jgi:hypothetical protein
VRNSSLVKRACADNVTGLSLTPKPGMRMVGERRGRDEGRAVSTTGRATSEDAGMSSEKHVRTMFTVSLRFPTQGQSASGESSLSRGRKA